MANSSTLGNVPGQSLLSPALPDNTRRAVGVAAATLLLGGGAALAFIPKANEAAAGQAVTGAPFTLPPNADVAQSVTDAMSFDEAFATARAEVGPGGVFVWQGNPYNTFWREEWMALSLQQRHEYAEHVLAAELPVRVATPQAEAMPTGHAEAALHRPVVIEGYLGEQRVIGIDNDNDGTIDSLVMADADGTAYRIVDQTGDEGMDTLYAYDPLTEEFQRMHSLDQPLLLTNAQLSQNLEETMARQVMDDMLSDERRDVPTTAGQPVAEAVMAGQDDELNPEEDDDHAYDDTYVNDGDVADMDYPNHAHGAE
jgi:hypothetical protein